MRKAVQLRLLSDDPAVVAAAIELLKNVLPDHFSVTGNAPNRHGPGQRSYGMLLVELPDAPVAPRPLAVPANPQSQIIDQATGWLRTDAIVRVKIYPQLTTTVRYVECGLVKYAPTATKIHVYVTPHPDLRSPAYRITGDDLVRLYDIDIHPDDRRELEQYYEALRQQIGQEFVLTAQGAEA